MLEILHRELTVQLEVVCGNNDFQAEVDGNVHVDHVVLVAVCVRVMEVLDHLL